MVLEAMAVLEQQQPVLVDRAGSTVGAARRLARGKATNSGSSNSGALDVAAGVGQGEQHAVELAAVQRVAGRLAGLLAQVELEARAIRCAAAAACRQQERRDGRDDAHAQLAGQRLALGAGHVGQLLGSRAGPARALSAIFCAERGEADDPPGALDQGDAEQRLELAQPGRKRRLGDEAGLGRLAEMAVLREARRDIAAA